MARTYEIDKQSVWKAWLSVKANKGSAGADGVKLEKFEENLKGNLYKIWNRMSSGSYFPPAIKLVEIPKGNGKTRSLGIPTVGDRVAQMAVKMHIEPQIDRVFYEESYGYRPGRSALDAVGEARKRCWEYDWVVDLDIKGFFDNIDHDLMMEMIRRHVKEKWVVMYIERWLKAPLKKTNGEIEERSKGTPQGGVISPLLANLFLHYAFDKWMKEENPRNPFERYADDAVIHCRTKEDAEQIRQALTERLLIFKLQLSEEKTKVVYCRDGSRNNREESETQFDFLGYRFRARRTKGPRGIFSGFNPAVSKKAMRKMRETMRSWQLTKCVQLNLKQIVERINPVIRGWITYYGKYCKSELFQVMRYLDGVLARWGKRKYKSLRRKPARALEWVQKLKKQAPRLLASWEITTS